MKPGNVPTSAVGPIIAELIAERWPHGGGNEVLAEKVGCDYETLRRITNQKNDKCDFNLADNLLCALGRVDIWQGQLSDIYQSVDLSDGRRPPAEVACRGCEAVFVQPKSNQQFCTRRCRDRATKRRWRKTNPEFVAKANARQRARRARLRAERLAVAA